MMKKEKRFQERRVHGRPFIPILDPIPIGRCGAKLIVTLTPTLRPRLDSVQDAILRV